MVSVVILNSVELVGLSIVNAYDSRSLSVSVFKSNTKLPSLSPSSISIMIVVSANVVLSNKAKSDSSALDSSIVTGNKILSPVLLTQGLPWESVNVIVKISLKPS